MSFSIEIRLQGWLDPEWLNGFSQVEIEHLTDGASRLTGKTRDQSEWMGLLNRLSNVGVAILDLNVHPLE